MLGSDDGIIASVIVKRGDSAKAAADNAKLITMAEKTTRRLIPISSPPRILSAARNIRFV